MPPLTFKYTNYKGITSVRRVIPLDVYWGSTEFYSEECWLMKAWDMDREDERIFCMSDMVNS